MKKIDENSKVTLTLKQLKKLVKESAVKGTDLQVRKLIEKIFKDAEEWIGYVSGANECAYTDDLLRSIVANAKDLEKLDEMRFPTTVSEDDEGPADMDTQIADLFDMYRACKVEPKVCNAIKADGEKTSIFLDRGNSVGGIARALRDGRLLKVIGFN